MAHRFSIKDIDEKFEQFLKESLSDDSLGNEQNQNVTISESVEQSKNKKHPVPWWITEDDSDDGIPDTSNDFLKSRRLSPSIEEVDEDFEEDVQLPQLHGVSVSLSKDSLESNDSVVALGPGENILGDGLDTLEEEEEKEKFFADLEKGTSSTIDYSKLNKELDSNNSEILHTFLRNQSQVNQTKGENDSEGDYSEDFEENSECNEDIKAEQAVTSEATEERTGMLAKVLLDSQESVLETPKANEQQDAAVVEQHPAQEITVEEMTGTGISSGQTNSDIEALHQAYRHVEQSLGATDEQNVHDEKIEVEGSLVNDTSQNKESCPQNTSITNSDLPTIEELMKPIRADSSFVRGFELEPVSPVKVAQDHTDGLMKTSKEHPNDTSVESQNIGCLSNHHGEQEDTSVLEVANESSKDSPHLKVIKKKLADKIKDVMKLSTLSNCSTLYQERKSGQVHQPNTSNKENPKLAPNKQVMYKNSKNTMIIHRKKHLAGSHSSVRSSGYGKSNSSLKHLPTVNEKTLKESNKNPLLKVRSPPRQKGTSVTKVIQTKTPSLSPKRNDSTNPGQPSSGEFPPEAKENDIQRHKISDTTTALQQATPIFSFHNERELYLLKRVQEAEEELSAANTLIERLKATSLQTEKEMEAKILERKVQQDKELSQLSQENYVLQTQLNNIKDLKKGTMWSTTREKNPNDEDMLKEIQKEIQNQEILLQGYHQENERLYKQVKELQLNNKKNEEIMFKENQRLMTQLAALQEKLEKNNVLSRVQNDKPSENQNFTDLISELRAAKATEANLIEERKHLKQDKQALEVDLAQMKKERDLARAQIVSASGEKSYEMKIMEESYKGEINRLQKRLQWYAENQELLDKDAARLRGAKEEISKLKVEVEKLRSEAGHHSAQQRTRLKNRAADAKRIQDLERQVKEMEGILKRRYPNSLPALIYAAATAASEGDGDATPKSNTVEFLEKRVKKLETELEGKDDEAKKSLRAMEQQFQKIKLQYEKRIEELEQLLAYKLLNEPQKLQDKSSSFDRELCKVNEAHQETVRNLQAEIDSLQSHVAQLESQKRPRDDDADLQALEYQVEQARAKAQLVRLNQEMIAKNREIKDLTKTVERLQKERRRMLSSTNSGRKLDKKGMLEKDSVSPEKKVPRDLGFFPDRLKDKIYRPNVFADAHISEVQQENAHLKEELEKLKLELNEERMTSQAALANAEDLMRRAKEELQGHIATLKVSHQKELERILCQQAREYSISKVAELNSKISSQESLIKYLQQQVHELQKEEGALAVSQRREAILQKEMGKLLEELKVARENQSPELKRFSCLERKIRQLETSYEQREQELQQVIQQTRYNAEVEHLRETEKWRKLALLKNQELEKFRTELDSMLDVLRQLQKQGVVITPGSSNMPENYWKI
ncbi:centrosomal protein of 162 kDa isoform 2-T2 [Vipera latastei]